MSFIRSSSATLIFKGLAMVCGFGVSVLTGRLLGPEGRGIYGLAMTVVVLSSIFGLFGFSGANAYLISGDKRRARAIGVQSLIVGAVGALLIWGIIAVLNIIFPSILAALNGGLLISVLALIPIFLWGNLFSFAFLGIDKVAAFNLFETGQRALFMGAGILVLLLWRGSLDSYIFAVAVAMAVALLFYIVWYFRSIPQGPAFHRGLLASAATYGTRSYVATILTYAVMRSGIFFVDHYQGTAAAGLFSTAQQMSELLVIIPSVIGIMLFSRVAKGGNDELTVRVMRTTVAIFLPIFIGLAVARNLIIEILYGAAFMPASDVFLVFLPGTFFLGLEVILASDIAGRGYPWPAALAWLPALALNIAGYMILTPLYGAYGAAASCTISFIAIFVFMLAYYRRLSGQKLTRLLVIQREDITAILALPMALLNPNPSPRPKDVNRDSTVYHKTESKAKEVGAEI